MDVETYALNDTFIMKEGKSGQREEWRMPVCECCGKKWSWKTAFKKMYTVKQKLTCPYCNSDQYMDKNTKFKLSIISMIPLFVVMLLVLLDIPFLLIVLIECVLCVGIIIAIPFFYNLSSKNEPLW